MWHFPPKESPLRKLTTSVAQLDEPLCAYIRQFTTANPQTENQSPLYLFCGSMGLRILANSIEAEQYHPTFDDDGFIVELGTATALNAEQLFAELKPGVRLIGDIDILRCSQKGWKTPHDFPSASEIFRAGAPERIEDSPCNGCSDVARVKLADGTIVWTVGPLTMIINKFRDCLAGLSATFNGVHGLTPTYHPNPEKFSTDAECLINLAKALYGDPLVEKLYEIGVERGHFDQFLFEPGVTSFPSGVVDLEERLREYGSQKLGVTLHSHGRALGHLVVLNQIESLEERRAVANVYNEAQEALLRCHTILGTNANLRITYNYIFNDQNQTERLILLQSLAHSLGCKPETLGTLEGLGSAADDNIGFHEWVLGLPTEHTSLTASLFHTPYLTSFEFEIRKLAKQRELNHKRAQDIYDKHIKPYL